MLKSRSKTGMKLNVCVRLVTASDQPLKNLLFPDVIVIFTTERHPRTSSTIKL